MIDRLQTRQVGRRVQMKLVVGPADDRYEREANGVAREVLARIDAGGPGRGHSEPLDRMAAEEDELLQGRRTPRIQRAVGSEQPVGPDGGDLDQDTTARIRGESTTGRPLDTSVRRSMEGAFGADFSSVRMHVGGGADRLNADLGARAFTTGRDVFVRAQDYRPATRAGQELIAHELTHVVQQGAAAELDGA